MNWNEIVNYVKDNWLVLGIGVAVVGYFAYSKTTNWLAARTARREKARKAAEKANTPVVRALTPEQERLALEAEGRIIDPSNGNGLLVNGDAVEKIGAIVGDLESQIKTLENTMTDEFDRLQRESIEVAEKIGKINHYGTIIGKLRNKYQERLDQIAIRLKQLAGQINHR